MKITEEFVSDILKAEYPQDYQQVYDKSPLLQYLDKKMKAVHGNSKTRRSLANIYAIYSTETISLKRRKRILNLTGTIICSCSTFIAVFMVEANSRTTL